MSVYNSNVIINAAPFYTLEWSFDSSPILVATPRSDLFVRYDYVSNVNAAGIPNSEVVGSSYWQSIGTAKVNVSASSSYDSSDLGVVGMEWYGFQDYVNLQPGFNLVPADGQLSNTISSISSDCCDSIFEQIQFRHNFISMQKFRSFLSRNGINLVGQINSPSYIPVSYSSVHNKWLGAVHYDGFSPIYDIFESWDLIIELYCDTNWKVGVKISQYNAYERSNCRLLMSFDKELVCPSPNNFTEFNVELFPSTGVSIPTGGVVVNDEAGILPDPLLLQFSIPPTDRQLIISYNLDKSYKKANSLLL